MLKHNPDAAPEMRLKPLLYREYTSHIAARGPLNIRSGSARSNWTLWLCVDQSRSRV